LTGQPGKPLMRKELPDIDAPAHPFYVYAVVKGSSLSARWRTAASSRLLRPGAQHGAGGLAIREIVFQSETFVGGEPPRRLAFVI